MSKPFYVVEKFRADVHAEELVHERISAIDRAFTIGDKKLIKYAVISLENWVLAEGFGDEQGLKNLQEIDQRFNKTFEQEKEAFKKEKEEALIESVLNKPIFNPPLEYYREKYIELLSLCYRKGILMKKTKEHHLQGDN
jgi:hypothetical protein